MSRFNWKRWVPPVVLLALFLAFVVWLNQVDKVALISREGQTFEKGVVTEILRDNIQPDGSRVGEQLVRIRMTTGELKGREIETTSSSGFLFGAPCTVGMRVVVMQSLSGDTVVSSVYSQDREMQIIAFALLYLVLKLIWWNTFQLGLAPLVIGMFFFSAVQLFFIGLIGEYLGAVWTQVKNKPLVIEEERINFDE